VAINFLVRTDTRHTLIFLKKLAVLFALMEARRLKGPVGMINRKLSIHIASPKGCVSPVVKSGFEPTNAQLRCPSTLWRNS
jgi:hypothetical protein